MKLSAIPVMLFAGALLQATPPERSGTPPGFFKERIQPVLAKRCYACHTEALSAGLRVDSREALLKGGDTGPAMVPGDPDRSLLIQAVRQTGPLKMPKGGKLSDQEIADFTEWVKGGAVWPVETAAPVTVAPDSSGDDFFENQIRPLLVQRCASCHTQTASSGLRVDSRDSLLKGGQKGAAIIPGNPDGSLLIQAVRQEGALKMPKGGKLTTREISDLVAWVRMGAPWPKEAPALVAGSGSSPGFTVTEKQRTFWSFQPLLSPAMPPVKEGKWAKTNIDRFVLAKLEGAGLQPVAAADRATLIRRATLDLTGLPPTPDEVAAFEKDRSPDAYAKVVDRLLASPRYGERWGRHWLDVARYGEDDVRGLDPKGRGFMPFNGAYVFRDWVIKAFNDDMPYGLFVKAQLAGDQLDKSLAEKTLAGTAFLGGGPWVWDQAEPVQGRADERNERIDAVTRGMLGLTLACARCHNHKYDPLSQKDYYALAGVFASTTYTEYPRVSEVQVKAWKQKQQAIDDLEEELGEFIHREAKQYTEILAHQTAKYMMAAWHVSGKPKATVEEAAEEAKLEPEILGRWVKFLAKPHPHYPSLNDWSAMIASGGGEAQAKLLADDFETLVLRIMAEAKKIDEENKIAKAKADVPKPLQRDALPNEFETKDQFCPGCDLELKALPTAEAALWLDLFVRASDADDMEKKPEPGVFVFREWALQRRMGSAWRDHVQALEARIEQLRKDLPKEYPFIHGVGDKPAPVNMAVNLRGSPYSLGDIVPRRFLEVLSPPGAPPFEKGSGRLELANLIAGHPLAARVIVNRVWKWHFGTGLVNTPDNFGEMGERPSNPELLEYLASRFNEQGMSIKKLNREIMLSAVYQLGAGESPANEEKDAANRLYWRYNRQRMDAEEIRDSILFVAGDLDLKTVGGPSAEFGPEFTRRAVYGKVSRFHLDNYLQVFDFPNPSYTAEQRFSTNVPLQRLFFMNSAFVYSQAGKLAERVYNKGSDAARIAEAYRLLYGREPTAKEQEIGLKFLGANPEKPGYAVAEEPATAWREYARGLLSSNEFEFVN
ncbi:MAG TPA: PSD1 and planctomycete cytochrome C domain-containing protein [Bryobacteraceae bacterium]|nr:PSD1 and planctomycete cytochrome C domain-containing protein [Bryobacteraceae bacterium]